MAESQEQQQIIEQMKQEQGDDLVKNTDARTREQIAPGQGVVFKIVNGFLRRSQQQGVPQAVFVCEIVDHPEGDKWVGRNYYNTYGIHTESGISWFKAACNNLEIGEPESYDDIISKLNEAVGVVFQGNLVANREDADQYPPNLFINRGARKREVEGGEGGEAF